MEKKYKKNISDEEKEEIYDHLIKYQYHDRDD